MLARFRHSFSVDVKRVFSPPQKGHFAVNVRSFPKLKDAPFSGRSDENMRNSRWENALFRGKFGMKWSLTYFSSALARQFLSSRA